MSKILSRRDFFGATLGSFLAIGVVPFTQAQNASFELPRAPHFSAYVRAHAQVVLRVVPDPSFSAFWSKRFGVPYQSYMLMMGEEKVGVYSVGSDGRISYGGTDPLQAHLISSRRGDGLYLDNKGNASRTKHSDPSQGEFAFSQRTPEDMGIPFP